MSINKHGTIISIIAFLCGVAAVCAEPQTDEVSVSTIASGRWLKEKGKGSNIFEKTKDKKGKGGKGKEKKKYDDNETATPTCPTPSVPPSSPSTSNPMNPPSDIPSFSPSMTSLPTVSSEPSNSPSITLAPSAAFTPNLTQPTSPTFHPISKHYSKQGKKHKMEKKNNEKTENKGKQDKKDKKSKKEKKSQAGLRWKKIKKYGKGKGKGKGNGYQSATDRPLPFPTTIPSPPLDTISPTFVEASSFPVSDPSGSPSSSVPSELPTHSLSSDNQNLTLIPTLISETPTEDQTVSPSDTPTDSPSVIEVTGVPTAGLTESVISVELIPFFVTYGFPSGAASEGDYDSVGSVTVAYLEAVLNLTLAVVDGAKFESLTANITTTDENRIGYEGVARFGFNSAAIPESQDLFDFTLAAFDQPSVQILIAQLQMLPDENPFSQTSAISFEGDALQSARSKTISAGHISSLAGAFVIFFLISSILSVQRKKVKVPRDIPIRKYPKSVSGGDDDDGDDCPNESCTGSSPIIDPWYGSDDTSLQTPSSLGGLVNDQIDHTDEVIQFVHSRGQGLSPLDEQDPLFCSPFSSSQADVLSR